MESYDLAILLAKALDSKKAGGLKVLKTEGLTTLADYFVICTATSNTQIKAMSDACEEAAEKNGERAHHIEGHRGGSTTWSGCGATPRRSTQPRCWANKQETSPMQTRSYSSVCPSECSLNERPGPPDRAALNFTAHGCGC